ncbi:NAD(P)-binding domain-containing protein [Dermacoccaceae bacterium W4C1]
MGGVDEVLARLPEHTDVLVIGGGQAGLSAAYFLQRSALADRYLVLDGAPGPGGAWQHRWPTLTLATANRVHDLPGYGIVEALGTECDELPAASAVPDYFGHYERRFDLNVRRPVRVVSVVRSGDGFGVTARSGDRTQEVSARAIINATGTWDHPYIPYLSGIETFAGRQLHTHDYVGPHEFAGQRVLVVGAGISATQLLIEIGRTAPGAQMFWCSRTEPVFTDQPFTPEQGREAVARVERRVRAGLPPASVVSVTGLFRTPAIRQAQQDGLMDWRPMFSRITPSGVAWPDGSSLDVDVIFWNTGFRSALDHLAPLHLRGPGGGIVMTGRLATSVEADPRIQLLGYGPSASTIGANRAGREAARVISQMLQDASSQ